MGIDALGAALSGLQAAQQAINNVSNNIANANTEGYTAKSLSQQTVVAGDTGIGVRTNEITRFVDRAIMRDYRAQLGVQGYHSTRESYLARVVGFHGSAEQGKNIGAQLGKLYQEFIELSATPDSNTQQQAIIDQAKKVATSFNNFSTLINDLRNDVQSSISDEVKNVNESLRQIAEYNKRIKGLYNVGQSTATLEDQRDMLVKKVASQLEVTYYTDSDNMLILQTKTGQVLVDTAARSFEFDIEAISPASSYPDSLGGLRLVEAEGELDVTTMNLGGKIGALLSLRDKELVSYNAQIDELAHKIAVRFNDQNLRLFTNGSGTVPGNSPSNYNGFAGLIQVNDSIVADSSLIQTGTSGPAVNPGENTVIMKIINYTFGRYKDAASTPNAAFNFNNVGSQENIDYSILGNSDATLEEFARAMLDNQASDYTLVKNTNETEEQYTNEVTKRLADSSSVNTDLELSRMIEFQRTYSASAKMINTLDELFRDLLNSV
jgi:flagellar hook-associated protein 1 FlgK